MVPSDPFMSHLATQLRYYAGEFQALQLIVLATFGVADNHLPPTCWSTFWKSILTHQLGCRCDILDSIFSFFCILTYAIIYVLIHHIIFWLYLYFLNILYFFKYSYTNIFHRRSLCTFYMNQARSAANILNVHEPYGCLNIYDIQWTLINSRIGCHFLT